MSGFTIRRFLLQNISAVLEHAPLPLAGSAARFLVAPAGSAAASFSLVTVDELAFIRKQREEEALESRIVLSTRPTRGVLRGLGGAALNIALGLLLSPLVALSVFFERLRVSAGARGLLTAPVVGPLWGLVFLLTAFYAAAQQAILSVYYVAVASPVFYALNRRPAAKLVGAPQEGEDVTARQIKVMARFWSPLACRFAAPRGRLHDAHPLLEHAPSDAALKERGLKRLSQRRQREEKKKNAEYAGTSSRAGGPDGTGESDYYARLGVDKTASEKEIKNAFNRLVLKLHPDRNPSPKAAQQFDQVTKAYRVLSNPEKRRKYDVGGASVVEDLGVKKREGVRAVFGGEALAALAGDVFMGSFSQRVIDGFDLTQEELVILRARMLQRCRDKLLAEYLIHYRGNVQRSAKGANEGDAMQKKAEKQASRGRAKRSGVMEDVRGPSASSSSSTADDVWASAMKLQLRKLLTVGLAKEVLYVLGHEYMRVIACYDAEMSTAGATDAETHTNAVPVSTPTLIARRAQLYAFQVLPHRLQVNATKVRIVTTVRSSTFKNSEAMIDLAWCVSVAELERTAQEVAQAILYDPSLTREESQDRRDALAALASLFIHYGQPYKGANKNTMDELMNSLRDYQQQRQREKDQQ